MKINAFVWAYFVSACWLLFVFRYLPHSEAYLTVARHPWNFIVVNGIAHAPVLLSLAGADWYERRARQR
ncbi:MAG: hypothetical protein K0Q94_5500 [Paenibacillus sp.]|nr:hypothetical protein [Paenibacillus sp.]